jgi:acyl-[acyl-carrier-protein] desaturase
MLTMETGFDSGEKPLLHVCAYVSFQELATRVSHRNTGRITGDPVAERLLSRVAKDENLHMIFYRNIMAAALDVCPDEAMEAIRDEVIGFAMPGAGMADFGRNSVIIAKAGIYDLRLHHDEVIMPVLRHWRVFDRDDIGPRAERARDELAAFLADLDARATRFVEKREHARARATARATARA